MPKWTASTDSESTCQMNAIHWKIDLWPTIPVIHEPVALKSTWMHVLQCKHVGWKFINIVVISVASIGVDFFQKKGDDGEIETPKASRGREWRRGVPIPSRLMGLGERCKLPQRGPGRSPGRKRVLVHSELERTHAVTTNLVFLSGGRPTWRGYIAYVIPPHFFSRGMHPFHPPQNLRQCMQLWRDLKFLNSNRPNHGPLSQLTKAAIAISNELERTITLFSRSHRSLTLNISQTAIVTIKGK